MVMFSRPRNYFCEGRQGELIFEIRHCRLCVVCDSCHQRIFRRKQAISQAQTYLFSSGIMPFSSYLELFIWQYASHGDSNLLVICQEKSFCQSFQSISIARDLHIISVSFEKETVFVILDPDLMTANEYY